jgi:cytochrome b pre-mRNA-processing protein 3
MSLSFLFQSRRDPIVKAAESLFRAALNQSRRPEFYLDLGVPDTFDGRFDLLVLHLSLVLNRLRAESDGKRIGQALIERFVTEIDTSLREIGVGDLGLARHVRAMLEGFYGRLNAYEHGLRAEDSAVLEHALRRNLFGTQQGKSNEPKREQIAALSRYMRLSMARLSSQDFAQILEGIVDLAEPLACPVPDRFDPQAR